MTCKSLALLGLVILLSSTVHAEPLETSRFPSLLSSLQLDTPLEFCDERVPLESQEARERLKRSSCFLCGADRRPFSGLNDLAAIFLLLKKC